MPKKTNDALCSTSAPVTPVTGPPFQHEPDFRFRYANNVRFHSTVHDLTLVFGQNDVTGASEVVKQNTAITLPWSVVKLALYYAQVNLVIHEAYNGIVQVPAFQLPTPIAEPTSEAIATDPNAYKSFEAATRVWNEFMASLTPRE